jgi:hypothetical protein
VRQLPRRAVLGSLGIAAVGGPIIIARSMAEAATPPHAMATWSPDIPRDGTNIFEGLEDDRAGSHKGVKHIYKQGDAIRFDIHPRDTDSTGGGDRQRNEARGMRQGGKPVKMYNGQTWRVKYDLFIPSSLQATNGFTHIMQLKKPGLGSAPFMVMSLRESGGPKIEVQFAASGKMVGQTPLTPLYNKWITAEFEFKIGTSGRIHWKISSGGSTVVDKTASGGSLWGGDSIHPKWGIYKKREKLANSYMLVRNMSASGG